MDFGKNSKKAKIKNGVRKGNDSEQLLIAYSGDELGSDTDSDRVQPLELPPTRLRRPKSRKIHVMSTPKSCCSLWNICQVLFVVVIIGMMVCMIWFTCILKTSLESMKRRVVQLETSDRSTSKACTDLGVSLQMKLEALRGGEVGLISKEQKHYTSILKQIAFLNKTVKYLNSKLKSPESASAINQDISLLKKGMADANREMTEVSDKVEQLRKIAHLQNINLKSLKQRMYNISVQVAKIAGQPTPKPITNTATQSWLLRVPADSSNPKTKKTQALEAEKLRKKEIVKLLGIMNRMNGTLLHQVSGVQARLTLLARNVSNHMSAINRMMRNAAKPKEKSDSNSSVLVTALHEDNNDDLMLQVNNLTSVLDQLMRHMGVHDTRFTKLVSDVTAINHTLYKRVVHEKGTAESQSSCNCSQPLTEIRNALATDEKLLKSLKTALDSLKTSIKAKGEKESSSPSPAASVPEIPPTTPTPQATGSPKVESVSPVPISTQSDALKDSPTTELETTRVKATRGTREAAPKSEENLSTTVQPVMPEGEKSISSKETLEEKELNEKKRMTDDDNALKDALKNTPEDDDTNGEDYSETKELFENS